MININLVEGLTQVLPFIFIYKLRQNKTIMVKLDNVDNIQLSDYYYYKKRTEDATCYYIFTITEYDIVNSTIRFFINNCYMFMVPDNRERKAFLYSNYNLLDIKKSDPLYVLSESEYINTYLNFMHNDKKCVYELPYKLIQNVE